MISYIPAKNIPLVSQYFGNAFLRVILWYSLVIQRDAFVF